jgi:hypothetical protein
VNSKQVVAVISAIVLIVILVYPTVSVGTVSVSLASARIGKADHVYVTIDRVWAHPSGQASSSGWVVVSNQSVSVDLASLQNSSKVLGSGQISSGDYDGIRIEVSNVTWVFNKTTTTLGIASPEIDGTVDYTVGVAGQTKILVTLSPQEEVIANSEYFAGTLSGTVTT